MVGTPEADLRQRDHSRQRSSGRRWQDTRWHDPRFGCVSRFADQLVREVASLGSAEQAAQWARTALPAKNTLTASDARLVEVAFALRLSSFETEGAPRDSGLASPETGERAVPSSGDRRA